MKGFSRVVSSLLCAFGAAKFIQWGIEAPNSSAADLFFFLGIVGIAFSFYAFFGVDND